MENEAKSYALITGATSGIGLELAKLFAQDEYNLVLVARSEQELVNVADELRTNGREVITVVADLFNPDAHFSVYEEVKAYGIEVEVLVNNAGQGVYGKFIETELQRELDIVQLNVSACIVLSKLFIKDMVQRGSGKVLNVSSIAGKIPGPYQAVYHGTKAFIHFFSEAIRSELKDTGVTVTSLLPGATDTDFFRKADMEESKIVQDQELEDPAFVAKEGYEALMAGKDKVVTGFKNKMFVAMGNVSTDEAATERMGDMQKPADQ
ncbi:SDR family oxidoreductase [Olivibacter sp. XZL3]|uniref:SDR family NAD(P)-dependent oxidoreductase n=1 Tax=Olivibacter sp. XZL3 TaxID=1735116 RepID=UPI001065A74B|nr:SDR family oxidoreductase [Olivibacter sp. XZL3]